MAKPNNLQLSIIVAILEQLIQQRSQGRALPSTQCRDLTNRKLAKPMFSVAEAHLNVGLFCRLAGRYRCQLHQ
jgi:hypothetical protein